MCLNMWSLQNELLNEFQSAIEYKASGRLSHLSIDYLDEGLFIEVHSATYYAVQLTLAATKAIMEEYPKLILAKLSFRVDGHPFVLCYPDIQQVNGQVASKTSFVDVETLVADSHHELSASPTILSPLVATATTS